MTTTQLLTEQFIHIPEVLLPSPGVDLSRWAVIACDQFTAEPQYWQAADELVGDAPSTLRMIWPEAWLGRPGVERLPAVMEEYVRSGVLRSCGRCLMLTRRQTDSGTRTGLVAALDLEGYDFSPGSGSAIRATEATVLERLPARVAVREQALLEMPHVLVLLDDPEDTVLGPLAARPGQVLYDTELMLGGGHITGTRVDDPEQLAGVATALAALHKAGNGMTYAVGDGNHSLAAARQHWLRVKAALPAGVTEHPARYALVEITNLHDPALLFEPIHRLVEGDAPRVLEALTHALARHGQAALNRPVDGGWSVGYVWQGGEGTLNLRTEDNLAVEAIQRALDEVAAQMDITMDYIHGADVTRDLGRQPGRLGLILPDFDKAGLFPAVRSHGILPRKSFSMGHAREKRYYMECRYIR